MNENQKEVSAIEARQKLGELLDKAYYRDDQIVIRRANKPMAAIISIQAYEQFLRQRDKDFSVLSRVWAKVPRLPQDEVAEDIANAISEVRSIESNAKPAQ